MTSKSMPWDDIGKPDADYNVRLIGGTGPVPLYWGKDTAGHCLFIVELEGDHTEQFRKDGTSARGIDVDLRRQDSTGSEGLVLTLEKHVDRDLFLGLCETLAASLRQVSDADTALAVSLTHIKRWKAFLAGRKSRLLSAEEVRGLFAELQFLRSLYRSHLDESAAVGAWLEPEDGHQDFIFGNTAVEIKSLSGRERSTVRISSEDQLESVCDNLFLLVFRLDDASGTEQSISLNGLVRLIEDELTESDAIETLSSKLGSYGYVEMREYDAPEFRVAARHAYRVQRNFPRLIRSELPDGIVRLGYQIELEKIAAFECDPAQVWGS